MVWIYDVAQGAKVGGLAAWRVGLGRAVGDLESHGDAHTWLQTNQVQSQAKPKNVCGHATGKQNLLRGHIRGAAGPIHWEGEAPTGRGATAAQAMLETRGPVSTIVNPRLDHASLRLEDGALRSAGVTWL